MKYDKDGALRLFVPTQPIQWQLLLDVVVLTNHWDNDVLVGDIYTQQAPTTGASAIAQ